MYFLYKAPPTLTYSNLRSLKLTVTDRAAFMFTVQVVPSEETASHPAHEPTPERGFGCAVRITLVLLT